MSSTVYGQTWTGAVDSEWTNAANWTGGVPGLNSAVTIAGNVPNSPIITTSVTIKDLTIGDWSNTISLTVDGGALTVSQNVTINDFGELKLQSGSIFFDRARNNNSFTMGYGAANITLINGQFTSDLNLTINGGFTSGNADVILNGTFTVPSLKTVTSGLSGTWTVNNSLSVVGVLDIEGANLNVHGTLTVGSGGVFNGGTGTHNYYGVFDVGSNGTYNGENSHSIISNSISAKNGAFITLNDGILEFLASVDLFQNASLEVLGVGQVIISGNGQFKQSGSLIIGNGTLTINGSVDFQQDGVLDVSSGTVSITGDATFSQSGTLNIEDGTLAISGDASFDQAGTVNAVDADITISGDLTLGSNGAVFNAGESTINLEGGTLTNNGTFNADSSTVTFTGTGTQTIEGDITFYNVVIETEGTLSTTGDVTVTNNATVDTSSTVSIASGSTLEVQGELDDPSGGISAPAPYVRSIVGTTASTVLVEFSEEINAATANSAVNYTVSPNLTIQTATLQAEANKVVLVLSGNMTVGAEYTFVLNNLVGAIGGQTISTNHTRRYTYIPPIVEPASGVTRLRITQKSASTMTLRWNPGDADGTLISIRQGQAGVFVPTNGQALPVTNAIDEAALVGDSYVAFAGTDSTVTLTGLTPNEDYFITAFTYNGTFPGTAQYNTANASTIAETTPFQLDIHLILAGAYNESTGQMSSELTELGILPLSQPFANTPWQYAGTESIASYPSNDIVDWVLVELRAANEAATAVDTTVKARQACFLMNDGSVVTLDGTSLPEFQFQKGRPFVVIVYQRNHLPAMSGDTLAINASGVFSVDFNNAAAWFDANSALQAADGIFMTSSGASESNSFFEVDLPAYNKAWTDRNSAGYSKSDVNMDGVIDASDRARIFNSKENSIQVPIAVQ